MFKIKEEMILKMKSQKITDLYIEFYKNEKELKETLNLKRHLFDKFDKRRINKIRKRKNIGFGIKIILRNVLFLMIIDIFIQKILDNKSFLLELKFSKITLKIKNEGYKNIFGYNYSDCSYYPNEIVINGDKQNIITYNYQFNQTENLVELIWNNSINYCECMFYDVLILQKWIYQILILHQLPLCFVCFAIVLP